MVKINVHNTEGKVIGDLELSDKVFGLPKNDDLVHQAMVAIANNMRQSLAHTKTRGERAGSGKKPWRQKGTGRARVGSVRTPVWRKGGIVFGPRSDRNYDQKINKKMKAQAIRVVLSGKLRDEEIVIVDKLELKEKKTKEMGQVLKNLKVSKKILMAYADTEKDLRLTSRNLKEVDNTLVSQLNVLDMLKNKYLVMSKESVKYLDDKYKK